MRHAPPDGRTSPVLWWPGVLVAGVTLVTFLPALRNDFVNWDDDKNFLKNPYYRGLGWTQLRWDWTSFHVGVYQPLAWMILGAEYLLFGLKPWGYHLVSLVLYAVNTVLLFVLTLTLLDSTMRRLMPETPSAPELPALPLVPFSGVWEMPIDGIWRSVSPTSAFAASSNWAAPITETGVGC